VWGREDRWRQVREVGVGDGGGRGGVKNGVEGVGVRVGWGNEKLEGGGTG